MIKIQIKHEFVGFDRKPGGLEYVMIGLLLPFMFIAGGGAVGIASLLPILEYRQRRSWAVGEALVESAQIAGQEVQANGPRHTGQRFRHSHHHHQQHDGERPRIVYRYTVDGTEYFNNRYRHGDFIFLKPHEVLAFTNQFAAGRTVPVYYDPKNPQRSVLQRAHSKDAGFFVLIGGVFVVVGLMIGLVYFSVMRRFRKQADDVPGEPPGDASASGGSREGGGARPSIEDMPPVPWPGSSR